MIFISFVKFFFSGIMHFEKINILKQFKIINALNNSFPFFPPDSTPMLDRIFL